MVEFRSVQKRDSMLQQNLDKIRYLMTLPYRNGEYRPWLEKATGEMKAEYGDGSAEFRRFVNAPGKAFVVGTETGREQEYQRQLESYEEVLRGLIGK